MFPGGQARGPGRSHPDKQALCVIGKRELQAASDKAFFALQMTEVVKTKDCCDMNDKQSLIERTVSE